MLFFFNFHGGAWKLPFTVQLGFNILIDRRAHLYFQEYILESTSPDSGTKDSFSLYFHVQQTSHSLMSPQTLILWVDEWSRACRLILINLLEIEHNRPWLSERNLYSIKSALQILPFVAMWWWLGIGRYCLWLPYPSLINHPWAILPVAERFPGTAIHSQTSCHSILVSRIAEITHIQTMRNGVLFLDLYIKSSSLICISEIVVHLFFN